MVTYAVIPAIMFFPRVTQLKSSGLNLYTFNQCPIWFKKH